MISEATSQDHPTEQDAAAPAGQRGATFGLALFILYAAVLTLIAVDQAFTLGIFPTPLDKYLQTRIDDLGSTNTTKVDEARSELVDQWGNLAVESLIRALERPEPIRTRVKTCLVSITGQDFGASPAAWSSWWDEHGEEY